jgi:16S rRNA (guanine966-N2)-methyltransferase
MQVTGGQLKGHKIEVARNVRPTLSQVRESTFSVLYSYFGNFENLTFLDLFAGSAIMSIEAQSRGFSITSLEKNRQSAQIIKETYAKLGIKPNLIVCDCMKFLKTNTQKFDVIYIDPPWCDDNFKYSYNDILELALKNLSKGGIAVFESEKTKKLSGQILSTEFDKKLFKEKIYGRCKLSFFKN